jgi:protein-disulfide isomerase
MSRKLNLVSAVSLAMAIPALGLSIYNTASSGQPDGGEVAKAVGELRAEVGSKHNALLDSFESRVEQSLESIIERRRSEAAEAAQGNAASAEQGAGSSFLGGPAADPILSVNEEGMVVYGNPDADITVITFEDFRCSFCEKYHPTLQEYVDQSGGKVNWIYKPYPVLGQASDQLALAGECVADLEGPETFWEYAKHAYATKNWNTALRNTQLSDAEAVVSCVQNGDAMDRVNASVSDGRQLNITGTPASVFRNNMTEEGALIPGYLQLHQIDQVVQEVLND